ncbi:hypothetical protein ES703_04066 [subsurface metagenome]
MKTKWTLCLLISLVLLLAIPILNCTPSAPPTPAPTPAPIPAPKPALPPWTEREALPTPTPSSPPAVDEPSFSEDEASASIWSQLPSNLPRGYKKTQFSADTKMAVYQGNGKWIFQVWGDIRDVTILPPEIYKDFKASKELGKEIWFEEQKQEVTTGKLMLTAIFYEKTRTVELENVEKYRVQANIETTSKVSLRPELMVHWIIAEYNGRIYTTQGIAENVGKIPLTGVNIEIKNYDPDGNLIHLQVIPLEPETIASGELGHFYERVYLKSMTLRTYTYKFISDSGEEIFYYKKGE